MRVYSSALLFPFLLSSLFAVIKPDVPNNANGRANTHVRLPLIFESNQGQLPSNASFVARGPGYRLLLSSDQVSLTLTSRTKGQPSHTTQDVIAIGIEGIDPASKLRGLDELPSKTNYFIGSDPAKWRVGVSTFARVKYENVYSGIDLVFYGNPQGLEFDLVVRPGADPNRIKFTIPINIRANIEKNGALALSTSGGTVRFRAPLVYQELQGTTHVLPGHFRLDRSGTETRKLSFVLGPYDRSRTLIIDPVLEYSTYLGGRADDWAGAVAVDGAGNAYITGTTASLDFPVTPNAVFPSHDACNPFCYDAFVAKINTKGGGLEYATYLGGSNNDFGNGIAIDSAGNAYVTGTTGSTDFPTTGDALQRSCGGTCFYNDAFATKLNSTGSALLYSTYLGGSGEDFGSSIAVLNNHAYVSGFSDSTDFPVTAGAFQPTMQGQGSSFVVQLNAAGTAENFGTFLGEVDLFDAGGSIAVDATGNSYVAGNTLSVNFPVTKGAFQTPFLPALASNMYILKLNPSGSALLYSALIGGAAPAGIAVDSVGNAYVVGTAGSFSPVTPGATDQSCDTGALIAKLNAAGNNLLVASHLCPDPVWPTGVAFDSSQNIIFSGWTDSTSLPTTVGSYHSTKTNLCCFSDTFLGKLNANGSSLVYLTYFGGNGSNNPNGLAQDPSGNIYLAGGTSSTNMPVVHGFQTSNAGAGDAFLAEFSIPATRLSVSPAGLSFPTEGIGVTSPNMDVTVANVGASSVSISNALTSGDFVVAHDGCGADLLPGANCTIAVSFKPSLSGNRTGKLTITDADGVQTVQLSGGGVLGPFVMFSPAYQVNTAAGVTSPPFPVTITNTGSKTLNISQISLSNGPTFNFYGSTNCFQPIPSLGTCTVYVTFDGSGFNQSYGTLSFTDNATGSPQGITLVGNVIGSGLLFTSQGIRFGQQKVGTSSTSHQVILLNGTSSQLTINSIIASKNFSQTHTCGSSLAAGAFCYVNVAFKPSSSGIMQGTVSVNSSLSANPLILPLLGTGK